MSNIVERKSGMLEMANHEHTDATNGGPMTYPVFNTAICDSSGVSIVDISGTDVAKAIKCESGAVTLTLTSGNGTSPTDPSVIIRRDGGGQYLWLGEGWAGCTKADVSCVGLTSFFGADVPLSAISHIPNVDVNGTGHWYYPVGAGGGVDLPALQANCIAVATAINAIILILENLGIVSKV